MNKLIYIVPNPITTEDSNSITTKILGQIKAFESAFDTYAIGYTKTLITVYHKDVYTVIDGSRSNRFCLYKCARQLAKEIEADFYYIRYGYSEIKFVELLKYLHKLSATKRIIVELPTYPYDKEMWMKGWKYRVFNILDRVTRGLMSSTVDAFATFSEDKTILGIKALKIINGVDFSSVKAREPETDNDVIDLIAVSAMGFNHAYERVIFGLVDYKRKATSFRKVKFHLVGDGSELPKYKQIVSDNGLEDMVKFYGYLKGEPLNNVYNLADIAIASLGMHRAGIKLASTLKTREYGAKGLPIVSSCKIDCYPDDWEYLLNVPADETSINIEQIVAFYDGIYSDKDRDTVTMSIRCFAMQVCDIMNTMDPIIKEFKKVNV